MGEFYGLERLYGVVSQHWAGSAEEVKDEVVRDARRFMGGRRCMMTLLLVVKQK